MEPFLIKPFQLSGKSKTASQFFTKYHYIIQDIFWMAWKCLLALQKLPNRALIFFRKYHCFFGSILGISFKQHQMSHTWNESGVRRLFEGCSMLYKIFWDIILVNKTKLKCGWMLQKKSFEFCSGFNQVYAIVMWLNVVPWCC